MRPLHAALAGSPAVLVLSAAVALALRGDPPRPRSPALRPGADLGLARASLMAAAPVGTPADVALARLEGQGLSCEISRPPLANLTWRVIRCSTPPTPGGALLLVDVAGRNGVVADIGVEDLACASRADVTEPAPEPGGCEISGKRFLDIEARRRASVGALLTDVLAKPGAESKPRR